MNKIKNIYKISVIIALLVLVSISVGCVGKPKAEIFTNFAVIFPDGRSDIDEYNTYDRYMEARPDGSYTGNYVKMIQFSTTEAGNNLVVTGTIRMEWNSGWSTSPPPKYAILGIIIVDIDDGMPLGGNNKYDDKIELINNASVPFKITIPLKSRGWFK